MGVERRVSLRELLPTDAPRLLALYRSNAAYLAPWDPLRPDSFYTLGAQEEEIRAGQVAAASDRAHTYGIVFNATGLLIGRLRLSNVVRGAFHNAYLGYWLDEAHAGRGLMTEAVGLVLARAFGELQLHRLQASTLPHNEGSMRVLLRNGFRREGLAERYLLIAGRWQDHLIFAITEEEWRGRGRDG